jgi:hypothetical protein
LLSMRKSTCSMSSMCVAIYCVSHVEQEQKSAQDWGPPVRSLHSRMVMGRTHSAVSLLCMHLQAMVSRRFVGG